jgi:hypothetical protein
LKIPESIIPKVERPIKASNSPERGEQKEKAEKNTCQVMP